METSHVGVNVTGLRETLDMAQHNGERIGYTCDSTTLSGNVQDYSMDLVDRFPDFYRWRLTRCAACGHEQAFDSDWFERWSHGEEMCPSCGVDCTAKDATRVEADPADLALHASQILRLSWWHTSTHADWPPGDLDSSLRLDDATRQRMGGDMAVERWGGRQREKALHVGTYEAAVQNMLRRIDDQGDSGKTFYLYRVRLRPDLNVGAGYSRELVDFVGDVPLRQACPPGVDATRYLNDHEDPGGISLALGRNAIRSVQRLQIPLDSSARALWRNSALKELVEASTKQVAVVEPDDALTRLRRKVGRGPTMTSEHKNRQTLIRNQVTTHLPAGIRDQVRGAVSVDDSIDPGQWCDHLAAILQLIDNPQVVIRAALGTTPRAVCDR